MSKRIWISLTACAALVFFLSVEGYSQRRSTAARPTVRPASPAASPTASFDASVCFQCHDEINDLWSSGRHKGKIGCPQCHGNLQNHMNSPMDTKPSTNLALENCGSCHRDQMTSFFRDDLNRRARVEKSQLTERSPNPFWDKLMMGHGFTKEHNSPRSHGYMLVDHLVVDRAYGGRFQPRRGWMYTIAPPSASLWDVLEDRYPDTNAHRSFIREGAAAANPTCLQCKTSDFVMSWRFMGDSDPNVRFARNSNVVDAARAVHNVVGCIHCHDPHATKPRVIRDALIDALTRPDTGVLWQSDPRRTAIDVREFRGFRKIALLARYDAKLQCGQCHVEYNCNPGYDVNTGERIGFNDRRTNHFPFKDVFQIYDHYNALGFRDFRHELTGGLLFKAQHPEAEVYWNSRHDRAGVSCNDCHMPKMRNAAGREFTSHWQVSPRNYLRETCIKCHTEMSEAQALYAIDSVKNHIRGKMRKAEFWLSQLIDKIVAARAAGVDPAVIREAQEQHQKAHILWEWWTAENSDGFHNPEQARESLTRSVTESRAGIKLLENAMASSAPAAH